MLDQYVQGMGDAIRSMTPEDLAANRDMVRDLNELIRERIGGDESPDVRDFLAKHGQFFPGAQTFDDIIDQLAQRMAAMQSLLRSMTPEQRAELESMMEALLRDDRLLLDLAELAVATWTCSCPVASATGCASAATSRCRSTARSPARPDAGDGAAGGLAPRRRRRGRPGVGRPRRGPRPARRRRGLRDLDALDDLARRLEEAGYLTRDGERLELTPRGTRRIGQKVLDDLFARLQRDAFGGHRLDRAGRGGERDETTKPYEFGDPFHLDLRGTLGNALHARGERAGAGGRAAAST